VKYDNVVRFGDFARGRSARRGAADKIPFEAASEIRLECPSCAALLRLPVAASSREVYCDDCGERIALVRQSAGESG